MPVEPTPRAVRVTRPVLALVLAVVLGALLRYVLGLDWPVLLCAVVAVFSVSGLLGHLLQRSWAPAAAQGPPAG